jgi:transposase
VLWTRSPRPRLTADRAGAHGRLWPAAAMGLSTGPRAGVAIEDCRHVSGTFERFLIARGERVVRVAPKYMAGARRSSRERGKADSIDAVSIARAALKEGIESLPAAHLG